MGFMQRFERKLEDAVGNTFARVFGGKIVPAEVEDALQREASHGLQNLSGHALAPNHYVLTVSDSDEENLTSDTELTLSTFAKHLTGFINEKGWETYGAVSVELESSPELHTGQFRARSVITPDDDAAAPVPNPRDLSRLPHPRPGAVHMPSESSPAPRPRYQQQPEPWQHQPPAQAYSQRPPARPTPQHEGVQYQDQQYQDQQYPGGQGQVPPRPEQAYEQQQYPVPQYPQSADRQPSYPAAQYSQPEPPVQAYSEGQAQAYAEGQQPGQSPPNQQRYSSERYADPRFQPPAHLYPLQQAAEGPPPPPQPHASQQPGQYVPHGYQDQAYAGQEYPLQDPSAAGAGYYADPHYAAHGGTPQQQPWKADGPGVSLELGDGSGRNLELRHGSNILGRGQDADFRIPDTGVSRQHADIQWDGAVALVVDLQSTNGTVVNRIPISEWQLADGDVIRMGHSDITVRFH